MPDPLDPGHIPGQNPATPERMPGHTRASGSSTWVRAAPWLTVGAIAFIALLYGLGVIGH